MEKFRFIIIFVKTIKMEFDDIYNEPEGNFIPGIFNYCNRWCERCQYTDRCRVFATEKIFMQEFEKHKRIEKSMAENKEFWAQVNKTIEEAADLIDEEIPLVKNEFSFDQWDFDMDDEDMQEEMKKDEENREKAENSNLSKVALKYENTVGKWFDDRKDVLITDFIQETKKTTVTYAGITDKKELNQISDAVEVILWYHIQIWVKLNRALTSLYEEEEDPEMYEDLPKDSDGSARVVLMGIDASIGSWNLLLKHLNSEMDSIKPIIKMLLWLRIEVEKQFPDARNFVWPPKED